jgi:hypothetical protein
VAGHAVPIWRFEKGRTLARAADHLQLQLFDSVWYLVLFVKKTINGFLIDSYVEFMCAVSLEKTDLTYPLILIVTKPHQTLEYAGDEGRS